MCWKIFLPGNEPILRGLVGEGGGFLPQRLNRRNKKPPSLGAVASMFIVEKHRYHV